MSVLDRLRCSRFVNRLTYNRLTEWWYDRRVAKRGWRAKAGWITLADPLDMMWLVEVGNEGPPEGSRVGVYDVEERIRWATVAVADRSVLERALRVVEPWVGSGVPLDPDGAWLFRPGYDPERAVAILTEAKERLAILDA